MNWKTWAPLAIAIALGLVAAKIAHDVVGKGRAPEATGPKTISVVVAKDDILPGQELKADDLVVSKLAGDVVPPQAFVHPEELVGRVTQASVVKGQAVLETLLAARGSGSGLQALVPEGMRAITIEVTESSGVAGFLVPGCRVDVLTTMTDSTNQAIAETALQNLKVTAVGQKISKTPGEDKELSRTVTLIASPKEAEELELLASTGRLRLVLRGAGDKDAMQSTGTRLADVRGDPKKEMTAPFIPPAVSKLPEPTKVATRTVTVIRGGVVTEVPMPETLEPAMDVAGTNAEMKDAANH